jgi:outer membrane protein OmpA-like peptidoglycan-associated protein
MAHPEGCSCAVTPVASEDHGGSSTPPYLWFALGVLAASILLFVGYYWLGNGESQTRTGSYQPPAMTAPPPAAIPPSGTNGTTGNEPGSGAYPGLTGSARKVAPAAPSAFSGPIPPYPASPVAIAGDRTRSIGSTPAAPAPANTAMAQPQPVLMHVAFAEAKSNLTRESFNVVASAASQSLQSNREISIRIFAIGQREADAGLWRRRLNAVRDELVRLGVPVARIRSEGTGPFMLRILKPQAQRSQRRAPTYDGAYDQRSLDDPFSNE